MSYLSLLDRVTNSMELGHYLSCIQARSMLVMCGNAHKRKILNRTHELKQLAAYCGGKRHASECAWCTLCIECFRVRYIPCGCGEEVTQWNWALWLLRLSMIRTYLFVGMPTSTKTINHILWLKNGYFSFYKLNSNHWILCTVGLAREQDQYLFCLVVLICTNIIDHMLWL
jgi:hypothetical protein